MKRDVMNGIWMYGERAKYTDLNGLDRIDKEDRLQKVDGGIYNIYI